MFKAYRRYAVFDGRSGRSEYWLFFLWCLIAGVLASVVDTLVGFSWAEGPVYLLVGLANLVPGLAVGVRRLHDLDKSGWFLLLALIPIVGAIILIAWFCQRGAPDANRFGPPDEAPGATAASVTA